MIVNKKTLEKLRFLINEETVYRKGPMLVSFFNELGFNDTYGQGFPSRSIYTDEKLSKINGTPNLDKCIKELFAPINYIKRLSELDSFIKDFNQYLAFDGWMVLRNNTEITFAKTGKIDIDKEIAEELSSAEDNFLKRDYELKIDNLNLQTSLVPVIVSRFEEINKCMSSQIPLAAIFITGSTLEGILLSVAINQPKEFNMANSAPKDKDNKVKPLTQWSLNNYIDVAYEVGLLKKDVMEFSKVLRDFRNYIHPFEQMSKNFNPDIHTANICFQVLKAAIFQIGNHK